MGCPGYAVEKGRCEKHKHPVWAGRRNFEGYKGEYLKNRAIVLKEEPYCAICGLLSTTVDHIVAVSKGGGHERDNLRGLCKTCHDKRSRQQSQER